MLPRLPAPPFWLVLPFLISMAASPAAASLDDEVGRSEVRVWSAPVPVEPGRTVIELDLAERLEELGYRRVRGRRPEMPGEFFWGHEVFWIYQRAHDLGARRVPARLVGLELRREDGRILALLDQDGQRIEPGGSEAFHLEPALLAESLSPDRAPRLPVDLDELPERVWRVVLAAEDARFFEHGGLDPRGIARALLKNALAGEVVQGGSTLTQQLVKMRDLTPRRTLGRKVSEAVRALALEADHEKTEILESYLDHVYFGHLEGVSIYGLEAAARAWFSKPASRLDLGEAALLAGMIQGPNRLNPLRHPERALERQRWVLGRLEKLGWAEPRALARERRRGLPTLAPSPPAPPSGSYFLRWVGDQVAEATPRRLERGRGVVVETTLDPYLQKLAEEAVAEGLAALRRRHRPLGGKPLAAALVALDAGSGDVLAYVGGDPGNRGDAFDRARDARRQPGSTVKPLVLLEAFERCGRREPLNPARRVADRPLRLDLPSGPWQPVNPGGAFHGLVDVRRALVESLNVPFVRIGRWCGFEATARRLERAGLEMPADPPPSLVLGSVETSPLELATAYTAFAGELGRVRRPRSVIRVVRPGGGVLAKRVARKAKVTSPATAYLVRDLMAEVWRRRQGEADELGRQEAFGKTGTSSEDRDAWFAGGAGSVVTVVWVGLDDNQPLGLVGSIAAAPIWRRFMERAVPARPARSLERPEEVVEAWVEEATGLRVRPSRRGARPELFRQGALPPHRRLWRSDRPLPVVE